MLIRIASILFGLTLTTWAQVPQLAITTTAIPNGTVGVAYSAQITSNAAQISASEAAACTWNIFGATLPAGISLTGAQGATATISGTTTKAGTYTFTITLTSGTTTVQKSLTFIIAATGTLSPPSISQLSPNPIALNTATTLRILGSGLVGSTASPCTGPPETVIWSGGLTSSNPLTFVGTPTATEIDVTIPASLPAAVASYQIGVSVNQVVNGVCKVSQAISQIQVAAAVPTISLTALFFTAPPGQLPRPQTVTLTSSSQNVSFGVTAAYSATSSTGATVPTGWLVIQPASGTAGPGSPAAITVSINQEVVNFPQGEYTASLTVSEAPAQVNNVQAVGANGRVVPHVTGSTSQTISVTLVISPTPLNITTLMVFGSAIGAPGPQDPQMLVVGSTTAVPFTYSIQPSTASSTGSSCSSSNLGSTVVTSSPWLLINGSAAAGSGTAPQNLTVSIQPGGLNAGTYRSDINIISAGIPYDVAVYLVVSGTGTNVSISFSATVGSTAPLTMPEMPVGNCPIPGQFPNAITLGVSSDLGWLGAIATTLNYPSPSFTITASPSSLTPGNYFGTVIVTDFAGEVTVYSVTLTVSFPATSSTLPHFATQGLWTTGIFVINTATAPANFSIAFYGDQGAPIPLPFTTGAAGPLSTLSGTLPAQGSAYYEASDPNSPLIDGWGQITADSPIVIQALFRNNSNGTYYEAAVPSNAGSNEFEIPFDATTFAATGAPFYTGFAIANLDPVKMANIICTARDPNGNVIPNVFTALTGPPVLNPLGHWAGYLFPLLTGLRGTIDCTSNTVIAATALRFIGNNAFSSLAVIDKPIPTATVNTSALPHFAAQDVWTTGIFVVNTSAASASFSIAFHQDNGASISLPFSTPTSNLSGTLPANGSAYYETTNLPGAPLIEGWGQISADPHIVIQALFRENSTGTYYEAAVPSNAGSRQFEIPFDATTFAPTTSPFYTGFAIANLDPSNPAIITCTARNSNGAVIPNAFTAATGPPQLNPLGHWAGYLFPALTGVRGTIICASTTDIAATALRFIGTNAFSSLPVIIQ